MQNWLARSPRRRFDSDGIHIRGPRNGSRTKRKLSCSKLPAVGHAFGKAFVPQELDFVPRGDGASSGAADAAAFCLQTISGAVGTIAPQIRTGRDAGGKSTRCGGSFNGRSADHRLAGMAEAARIGHRRRQGQGRHRRAAPRCTRSTFMSTTMTVGRWCVSRSTPSNATRPQRSRAWRCWSIDGRCAARKGIRPCGR